MDNIDLIFGHGNRDDILCYEKLLNLCRQKVTKYFGSTQDFTQKEEIAFIAISRVYTAFKNKLNKLKNANQEAVLFFYLSQLYCYIDLAVRNEVIHYKKHEKKMKQNTLEFKEDVDYTAPIDSFIGHDANDFSKSVFNEKMIDKNGEVYCHNNIDSYLLDNSLNRKENELHINSFNNKLNSFFTNDEIKVLNKIYLGISDNEFDKKFFDSKLSKIREKINNNECLRNLILKFLENKNG